MAADIQEPAENDSRGKEGAQETTKQSASAKETLARQAKPKQKIKWRVKSHVTAYNKTKILEV